MESMVEETGGNSRIDPLSLGPASNGTETTGGSSQVEGANILTSQAPALTVLKTSPPNVVHLISHPTSQSSVIQSSVIQSATHHQGQSLKGTTVMSASPGTPAPIGHAVYVTSKNSSVIQAPGIRIKQEPYAAMQAGMDSSEEDDSCSDEDAVSRKRRDMLTRRPSYHKILKEISGPDMTVLSGPVVPEDQTRKREIRLQKNREAARECRRKKKEYIKCLENRVAVLENQNKALIEELKSLKELYCMSKTD